MTPMTRKVIYTAIIGAYRKLQKPPFIPTDWDFVCFTDRADLKSSLWHIHKVTPTYTDDPARQSKTYKILPHTFLPEYDISIWMDVPFTIKRNPDLIVAEYLTTNLAVFNHAHSNDSRDCVYEEARVLLTEKRKDDPATISAQVTKYQSQGYPEHHGLATCGVLIRRHNEPDIVEAMEAWWNEITAHSKRDQLSFNYIAWKHHLRFIYLPGDIRNNEWFGFSQGATLSLARRVRDRLIRFLKAS